MAETRKQLFTTEFETYVLGGRITTDGSGDPTLSDNVGISSVSKTATGTYKVVLKDKAARLISFQASLMPGTPTTAEAHPAAHDVDAASPYVTVEIIDHADTVDAAADLVSGEIFVSLTVQRR